MTELSRMHWLTSAAVDKSLADVAPPRPWLQTDTLTTVRPYRMVSITSGQTAETLCTHTGTHLTMRTTLWRESVCTWTWAEAGGELTVTLRCPEPCVTYPHRVSAASVNSANTSSGHSVSFFVVRNLIRHSPAFVSQEVRPLSHTRWCVPPPGWNLAVAVTTLSLWCRDWLWTRQESTADRKVGTR